MGASHPRGVKLTRAKATGLPAKGSSCGIRESAAGAPAALRSEIAINRAAVGDPQCENHEFRVFDRVDDPVVADPDPPQVWISDERSSATRSRADAQGIDGLEDAARCRLVQLGQLLESLGVILDCVRPSCAYSPSARAASSAGTAVVRPASRSASRS